MRCAPGEFKLARANPNRTQLDGAAAPSLPPPQTLRRDGVPAVGSGEAEPLAPVAEPRAVTRSPAAATPPASSPDGSEAGHVQDVVDDLLSNLEETLGLIRTMKSAS